MLFFIVNQPESGVAVKFPAIALLCLSLSACASKWTSNNYVDQAAASRALGADKKLCQDFAREQQALNFGFNRYSRVQQPLEEAANYLHNYAEGMDRQDIFTKCMNDRGWEQK